MPQSAAEEMIKELEGAGDKSLEFRLACASHLLSMRPELAARLLRFWRDGYRAMHRGNGRLLGELLSRLACCLPDVLRTIYCGGPHCLETWNELLQMLHMIRDELLGGTERPSTAVVIRGARMLQMMVMGLTWQRRSEGDQDAEEDRAEEMVTLQHLSRENHQLRAGAVREEANKLLDSLIMLVWRGEVALAAQLAIVNLLGRTARRRPTLLAKIIPTLIDLYEAINGGGGNGSGRGELKEHQRMYLENTLERQLAGLVEMPAAEKFYPLIVEALKKSSSTRSRKRRPGPEDNKAAATTNVAAAAAAEEEEEDATLAAVGTKRMKIDSATAELRVERLNFHHAAEVLIATMRSISMEQIRKAIEGWRPSPQVRDPRRAPAESAPVEGSGKTDQIVPFALGSRELDAREYVQLFLTRFKVLLEGFCDASLLRDKHRRKGLTRSLLRLAMVLQNLSHSHSLFSTSSAVADLVVAFCFENVEERMSLLLYWLRILWVNAQGAAAEESPAVQELYDTCYTLAVESLQQLVAENATQWQVPLQKFLQEAPLLCADLHVRLLDWICSTPATRMAGLVLVEQLIINRPALRDVLFGALLMNYCQSADESLRKAAITILVDSLGKSPQYLQMLVASSTRLLEDGAGARSSDMYVYDLPLRLACSNVQLLELLLSKFDEQGASVKEYLLGQVSVVASLLSPQCCEVLVSRPLLGPAQALVERLVESLLKNSMHATVMRESLLTMATVELMNGHCVGVALESIGNGRWPVRILDSLILCASAENKEQVKQALHAYIQQVDAADEASKAAYANLLAKVADILGPVELFVHLHRLESSVPLKRLVDVIQFCFLLTIVFKPDTLAAGLTQLAQLPTLPTMLLRSILQSVSTHRALTSMAVGLLSRLIERSIWTYPKLWDGFVRCLRTMVPASHAVMLQLPVERLEEVLVAVPELKMSFLSYLRQQSKAVQSRFPEHLFR